jgi:hypothetical protein
MKLKFIKTFVSPLVLDEILDVLELDQTKYRITASKLSGTDILFLSIFGKGTFFYSIKCSKPYTIKAYNGAEIKNQSLTHVLNKIQFI